MNNKQQVTSIDLAQAIAQEGVELDTMWHWGNTGYGDKRYDANPILIDETRSMFYTSSVPAPTSTEWFDMLPEHLEDEEYKNIDGDPIQMELTVKKAFGQYHALYEGTTINESFVLASTRADKLADALAYLARELDSKEYINLESL